MNMEQKVLNAILKKNPLPYAIPGEYIKEVPIIELPIKGPRDRYAELLLSGDYHFGHRDQALESLAAYLNLVKKLPHIRVVCTGDLIDAAVLHGYCGDALPVRLQIERACQYIKPVADRYVVVVTGNHDDRINEKTLDAINWLQMVFEKMGSKAMITDEPGRGITVVFKVGKMEYPAYIVHSKTGAITNEFSFLLRAEKFNLVPILIAGHNHQLSHKTVRIFAPSAQDGEWKMQVYDRHLCLAGSFLERPAYSEAAAYPPTTIGSPIIRLSAVRKSIEWINPATHYAKLLNPKAYQPDLTFRIGDRRFK